MSTLAWALGSVLGLGGAVAAAVYCYRRVIASKVSADEQSASLQLETERAAQQERAAEAERATRRASEDAKIAAVTDVAGADQLLRDATSGQS